MSKGNLEINERTFPLVGAVAPGVREGVPAPRPVLLLYASQHTYPPVMHV